MLKNTNGRLITVWTMLTSTGLLVRDVMGDTEHQHHQAEVRDEIRRPSSVNRRCRKRSYPIPDPAGHPGKLSGGPAQRCKPDSQTVRAVPHDGELPGHLNRCRVPPRASRAETDPSTVSTARTSGSAHR